MVLALSALAGCKGKAPGGAGLTAATHRYFPIDSGTHAVDCASCHTSDATFTAFSCTGCHAHDQGPIDLVHTSVATYAYTSADCYRCHQAPTPEPFSHTGIGGGCAFCHDVGASFAALPKAGFTHLDTGGADCSGCHGTSNWNTAAEPPGLVHDPARDVAVTGEVPSYAGTRIAALTSLPQTLHMQMDHRTAAVDATALGNCGNCHAGAASGVFYPGALHSSLANLGLPQPTTCGDCHGDAAPAGFVGPTATARQPPSGEMKHDAVAWSSGAPTTTPLVTADCAACHASPSATLAATWATGAGGAGRPGFHAGLAAAGLAQPATCVDCHANTRPAGTLTSTTAALPAQVTFDHGAAEALADCAPCHAASAAGWTSWAGGRLHRVGSSTPQSCLPCHAGERPASAAGWTSATFTESPFDYGTSAAGVTHGDGQDCAACHAGPGAGGAWGGAQSWVGGHFAHGAGTVASATCSACHASQRPDLQPGTTAAAMAALLGFDHAANGTGDCIGCHQATVTAGQYLHYGAPSTGTLPGGDWAGGVSYPGAQPVSAPDSAVTLTELTLTRTGGLVTGWTSTRATLYGAMQHTSAAIPAAVSPGPAASPDGTTCWHCHTNTGGTVTSYAGGRFHAALGAYAATPGGPVTPLPQPTSHCADCHANMRPSGIVEAGGSTLQPMDHAALFSAGSAADLDCSTCHARPGDTWSDGAFHARIGGAVPADCTVCHYPLMASAAADVTSGALYAMKHRSPLVAVQRCDACHAGALAASTATPLAATQFRPGAYHAGLAAQPAACLDCHAGSVPAGPTQSSVVYALDQGGTATNGAQWMSHAAAGVAGVDCATCHAADAAAGAWRKSTSFHAVVKSPASCQGCHGLGASPGTNDNRPAGLTDSSTLTTASADPSTGVPAGTHDQVTHADVNASGHDCNFCHTQVGPSTAAGVQGHEWAQARFHASFSSATPLVLNGTTGRCADCHLNVEPGTSFTAMDHAGFTNVSGSQDCSSCHAWPGAGGPGAPDWRGASGAPQYIAVGGFTVPSPPAATPSTQGGIANLPHPSTASTGCATCHPGGAGGKGAQGYDHASALITTACDACHEAGSNLVHTPWNGSTTQSGGAGDTRPYTITSLRATRGGDSCTVTTAQHFYPVDCYQCHPVPSGNGLTTTGTPYTAAWTFPHSTTLMSNPSTCNLCHTGTSCPK